MMMSCCRWWRGPRMLPLQASPAHHQCLSVGKGTPEHHHHNIHHQDLNTSNHLATNEYFAFASQPAHHSAFQLRRGLLQSTISDHQDLKNHNNQNSQNSQKALPNQVRHLLALLLKRDSSTAPALWPSPRLSIPLKYAPSITKIFITAKTLYIQKN